VLVSWSGGKDSALALRETLRGGAHEVFGLLTTFSEDFDRVSMHGVRRDVAEAQARALGLPLFPVLVPRVQTTAPCPLTVAAPPEGPYERRMREALTQARDEGVRAVVSGDIFLEDVRAYREARLREVGLAGIFPLWGRDTQGLAREFIDAGFQGVCVCADATVLDRSFAGRPLDHDFFAALPEGVDPSGERGEFHTFVQDGPVFASPVHVREGEVVYREPGFWFQDLLPAGVA
jgi:uncharacterized protein (TIGR00290 family)